jgi:hypothetical protein
MVRGLLLDGHGKLHLAFKIDRSEHSAVTDRRYSLDELRFRSGAGVLSAG